APFEGRNGEFYEGLTRWRSAIATDAAGEAPMIKVQGASVEDAFSRANHLMLANRWGDGLPLWPPTRERVDWILRGSTQPRRRRIGIFPPRGGVSTVEKCAIALELAWGGHEYLPMIGATVGSVCHTPCGTAQLQAASGSA